MTIKSGYYAQDTSLLSVHVDEIKGLVTVKDHSDNATYTWVAVPHDCKFLASDLNNAKVKSFIKKNPQCY